MPRAPPAAWACVSAPAPDEPCTPCGAPDAAVRAERRDSPVLAFPILGLRGDLHPRRGSVVAARTENAGRASGRRGAGRVILRTCPPALTSTRSRSRSCRPRWPAARTACAKAASGCTCGSAWSAATSAAATTRRTNTPASTRGADEHPLIRSLEPGEEWSWCFVDEVGMVIPEVHGSTRIPPSPMLS